MEHKKYSKEVYKRKNKTSLSPCHVEKYFDIASDKTRVLNRKGTRPRAMIEKQEFSLL